MPNAPFTGATHIQQGQSQKEVTANAGLDRTARFMAGTLTRTGIAGDTVLTETETLEAMRFVLQGAPAAAFQLGLEGEIASGDGSAIAKELFVDNQTGQTATVGVDDGAGGFKGATVALPAGRGRKLYTDGTAVTVVAPVADVAAEAHDLVFWFGGQPADGATLAIVKAARAFTIPAGMTGSQGEAAAAPTGAVSIDVRKNGGSVGSIDWAASATVPTFTMAAKTSFAAGDKLALVAPSPQDATFADVTVTILGTKD